MNMKWIKAGTVGALASVVMFIFMFLGIMSGNAPFNLPPSAAFLERLGLNVGPLPILLHLGYGAIWSIGLVALFQERANVKKGIVLALGLWLFMMVVYSPIIGWGFFGFGGVAQAADHPLYLEPGPKYAIVTLVLHLIYGSIIGWLNPLWLGRHERRSHMLDSRAA